MYESLASDKSFCFRRSCVDLSASAHTHCLIQLLKISVRRSGPQPWDAHSTHLIPPVNLFFKHLANKLPKKQIQAKVLNFNALSASLARRPDASQNLSNFTALPPVPSGEARILRIRKILASTFLKFFDKRITDAKTPAKAGVF